jgi:hypothetical protein
MFSSYYFFLVSTRYWCLPSFWHQIFIGNFLLLGVSSFFIGFFFLGIKSLLVSSESEGDRVRKSFRFPSNVQRVERRLPLQLLNRDPVKGFPGWKSQKK